MDGLPARRWLARAAAAAVVVSLLVPAGVSALTYERQGLEAGTVASPADGSTYVGVQGFHFQGWGSKKKPSRIVSVGPRGEVEWANSGGGDFWVYDVDPLPNGNLLVTSTVPGDTVVYEYDPERRERVWSQRFDATDTHDVDLINGDELLVAHKSNFRDGASHDRVFVYNLTTDAVTWEWTFKNHYPASTDGGHGTDWTHVNDVDKVGPGQFLVSPRNFDQVILLNRSTKAVEWRLGADEAHRTLREQHNPDLLRGPSGNPTVLVADSENDRVVEYACVENASGSDVAGTGPGCRWVRTWALTGDLNWPRDADRLPNGNTLVVDSLNHRVIEVTPRGEVVWEFYAPWAPYDAERGADGSQGPTMREQGVTGTHRVHGGAGEGPTVGATFPQWLVATTAGTPLDGWGEWVASRYAHVTPFLRPVWMSSWDFAGALGAVLVLLGWGAAEAVYHREAIRRGLLELVRRPAK